VPGAPIAAFTLVRTSLDAMASGIHLL